VILHAVERGQGGVRPLVLLHGLFGRAANFGAVHQRLAQRRRVVALDLRNHGASGHDARMDYLTMAGDVVETLRSLGALPCVLAGHSMGGKVAMCLALHDAPAVARLLVGDVAPVPYPPHFRAFAQAMLALDLSAPVTRADADAALAAAVPDRAVRGFLLQNLSVGSHPAWTCGLAEIAAALPDIEGFPAIDGQYQGPTLILSGVRSDYVLPDHHGAIRARFPHARFVSLHKAGHWLHADDPDGFVSVVEAFAG
jgi:pimeloyl-ACP methyl ester carboxylesterase